MRTLREQGVLSLMMLAKQMDGKPTVLNYANSGDVTKNMSRVVGYGSIAFSRSQPDRSLSRKERKCFL